MKEKTKQTRTKEEQVKDIERKLKSIEDQIETLLARKTILTNQLKRMDSDN